MRRVLPDVWESATESPFPGLTTHGYLLVRPDGNVLFYSTGLGDEIDQMAELGGVAYQCLSHRDEIDEGIDTIRVRHGAQLIGSAAELDAYRAVREPEILIRGRQTVLGHIEAIPTPSHTPGSTCFLVGSGEGGRYLFTGDTIYRNTNGWSAGYIEGYSELAPLLESLRLIAGLEPDVVFSSAFAGSAGFEVLTPAQWRRYVEDAIEAIDRTGAP